MVWRKLSVRADISFERDNNYSEAETLSREAIDLYKKTSRKRGLNRSYWRLGTALHSQSIFDEAVRNYDTSYTLSGEIGDSLYVFYSAITAAGALYEKSDYKNSLERTMILHQLITNNNESLWKPWELANLGNIYFALEDYSSAVSYYRQVFDYPQLTITFALNKQFDSATKYFNQTIADTADQRSLRFYLAFVGKYYLLLNENEKALPNLLRSLRYNKKSNDVNQAMLVLIDISKTYLGLKNRDSAFAYSSEAFAMGSRTGAGQIIKDASKILSLIFEYRRQPDSAYFYYKKYTVTNDSVLNDQVKGRLAGFAFEQKIELLNKRKRNSTDPITKAILSKKYTHRRSSCFFVYRIFTVA